MTTSSVFAVLLAATGVALAGGCSLQEPYSPAASTSRSSSARDAGDPAPERGGTIPPAALAAQHVLAPRAATATPQKALDRYAWLAVNWTWHDLTARERRLASISIGQARAQALQASAQASANSTLQTDRVSNTGRAVSIAPGQGPAAGRWVVVTAEHTHGTGPYAGLPPGMHVTYAQLTHTPSGYLLSQWHPIN